MQEPKQPSWPNFLQERIAAMESDEKRTQCGYCHSLKSDQSWCHHLSECSPLKSDFDILMEQYVQQYGFYLESQNKKGLSVVKKKKPNPPSKIPASKPMYNSAR